MTSIEQGIGLEIVLWFQSWGKPVLWWLLYPFHHIGSEYGFLVLLPVVYWSVSKYHGKRLMVLSLATGLIGQYLKFGLRRPRPFVVAPERVSALVAEEGFGLPSGHTLFGTSVAGYVWYRAPGLWPRVAAVAFALLMGISRMVHGVHFPQDVLAGWLLGIALVVIFWVIDTRFISRMYKWSLGTELIVAVIATIVTFIIALVVEHEYEERKAMLSIVGALLGGLTGFALERRLVRFSSAGTVGQRVVRGLVGLVSTVVIYIGFDLLYDLVVGGATGTGALVLYVIRYAIVAFWIGVGAPWLFVRTRLAASAVEE